jgi:hypothetical protein
MRQLRAEEAGLAAPGARLAACPPALASASRAPRRRARAAAGGGDAAMAEAGGAGAEPDGELITPEVPAELLTTLTEMGFSVARATRALYATGTDTAEVAVNWIMEHQEDADIDEPLLVPKNKIVRASACALHARAQREGADARRCARRRSRS